MTDPPKLKIALLVTPETTASTVYGMYDLFCSAGRDWDFVVNGRPGAQRIEPRIVAASAAALKAANGIWLKPDCSFADYPNPDVVCVSDLFVTPDEDIASHHAAAINWLKACHTAGATVASACSGAMLLAATGLLDGSEATTHWAYCEAMAKRYPRVKVSASRALVASGDGQRVVTSGGGSTWYDMALFLIARFLGQEEAMRLAKLYLLDWHRLGQQPFASLARRVQGDDAVIGTCQEWIAERYANTNPVAGMIALSGLTERTFKRRFRAATGMSPLDYVHTVRIEESKQLLETTEMSIEAVAQEVGYEDGSFFRRLFRREVAVTPAQYRRQFGPLRKALRGPGAVPPPSPGAFPP
ncbi:MAG: helix-turn-helix domain-containing protein [Rhodospirillales bacterium]|nr:helix-turn-helix domain-containing protein [Rhodospirillales bacterium]